MKKLILDVEGQAVEVVAQKIAGKLWYHLNGETHVYEPTEILSTGGGKGAVSDPSKISAPMPGKIIKILKSIGDAVSEGDTVVVMEAMKMEYNLKVSQDLTIKKINCKENQTVSLGQILVEMES